MSYLRFFFRELQRVSAQVMTQVQHAHVMAETPWLYGVHNYLHNLLVKRPRRHWERPDDLYDIVVCRPSRPLYGWSRAPQVSGAGMVHLVQDMALGTYHDQRVGYARWVCGGHSTYPATSVDPYNGGEMCERCVRLDPWREVSFDERRPEQR